LSDKLRVHILSKELGVTSKAIVAKCKSEGVEGVTNHMSTVSAGLAETIREWFSEGTHVTSVETAAPVDLQKARVKRRPTRRKKQVEPKEAEPAAAEAMPAAPAEPAVAPEPAAPAVAAEAPGVTKEAEKKVPEKKEKPETARPATAPAVVEVVTPGGPLGVETPAKAPPPRRPPQGPKIVKPAAKAPEPLTPVGPAGPQNVPAPAQMKGPKVVGFAKPEPIVRPSPRPVVRSTDLPDTARPDTLRTPRRGDRGKGVGREEGEGRRSRHRVNPRRSSTSVAEVGEQLREWGDRDWIEREERLQEATGRGIHARRARETKTGVGPARIAPRKTRAQVTEPVVVHELCAATGIGLSQLFPRMMNDYNLMIARNTVIPTDVAELVMLDFGVELEVVQPKDELDKLVEQFAARPREHLKPRPPVVTMLGHVDHGKTSLLDAIRRTSVVEGEVGGITQHIGAYRVERGELSVTFLDTPGHEAFTAMRARGANLTDVVVLVVAADDGLMPQTIEAINHAKAGAVPIVVALNKIDLPGLDINKIYGQLAEMELVPTEWGGETDVVKTSAVTGEGVEALIEHLATLSELLALKADPTLPAQGAVIESEMQPGVGPIARVLVQEGTLRTGDFIVCGPGAGRVRMMRDDRGRRVKEATPGTPVEVGGLDEVPNAGDSFHRVESLPRAKQVAEETKARRRQEALTRVSKARTLEDIFQQRETGEIPELNLILRADVQGSVDALVKSLEGIPSQEVHLNILHSGIGSVTESDVVLADASGALIVGFNIAVEPGAQRLADSEGVEIRLYRVIYEVIEDIREALEGLLPHEQTEEIRGRAEVRQIFRVSRVGVVAGCLVAEGPIGRSHFVRVVRNGQIIVPTEDDVKRGRHRPVSSLRHFKDDVREVRAGMECGIRIEDFDDVKPGDVIETYEVIERARKL